MLHPSAVVSSRRNGYPTKLGVLTAFHENVTLVPSALHVYVCPVGSGGGGYTVSVALCQPSVPPLPYASQEYVVEEDGATYVEPDVPTYPIGLMYTQELAFEVDQRR